MKSAPSTDTTNHTPGPWHAPLGQFDFGNDGSRRVMYGDSKTDVYGRIGTVDTRADRKQHGKNATPYNAPDTERDANALLIAAAPDMLSMLQELRQMALDDAALYGHDSAGKPFYLVHAEKIEAIIRKATHA